jgi:hypothetical protein
MSPSADKRRLADEAVARQTKIEAQLDEALAASFPASDPVSIVTSQAEDDWVSEDTARKTP